MHRFTFHFQFFEQGWSETLFRAAPFGSGEGNLLENYIINRLQLLCTEARLVSVRASNVDSARDITIYPIPTAGRRGTWVYEPGEGQPAQKTSAEDSFTALLLRLSDGAQHYRSFPMLGFPDYAFNSTILNPDVEPVIRARLNGWIAAMPYAGFGMKMQGAPAKAGRIAVFSPKTADNKLICLGLNGTMPVAGDYITLGSVKPFNKLNRTWRVASTTPGDDEADGYVYLASTSAMDAYGPVQGGIYKVPTYTLAVLNQYTISRITSRKTGVPFNTVRGRRSGRLV